ncbi:MAG: D-arabinono-1,4-lactone oxidase [Jatrophihabitantaceae bacterium]
MPDAVPSTNWARNVTFAARARHRPAGVAELQELVAHSSRLRVLGTGHSFNRIADTTGDLVSVAGLPPVVRIEGTSVTVSAGMAYGELAEHLHRAGFALRNLASLPHICVAGACATGTHGSGNCNASLAASVSAVEFVRASGELVRLGRGDDGFRGAVVALGCLGVLTSMTLDVVPTFELRQQVYLDLAFDQLVGHFDEIFGCAYSINVFTNWRESAFRVWVISLDDAGSEVPLSLGATPATEPQHPIPGAAADNCTVQGGVPGPWHERLPHFRPDLTPSVGDELQSEYLIAYADGPAAIEAIGRVRSQVAPALLTGEIRTVAADDLWLSPSYGRDSVAFHFTWVKDDDLVRPAITALESALAGFDARAHWGKLFSVEPALVQRQYERLPDFRRLMAEYDPHGKFGNELVERYLSDPDADQVAD